MIVLKILVTGGTGYIGSHTVVELLEEGHEVVVIDNFSNSKSSSLDAITQITGKTVDFYEGDVSDISLLEKVFQEQQIDAVIHFAGFKAVGESVSKPILYYDNNLISTIRLLEVMEKYQCYRLVFSSSATVYGNPKSLPIHEDAPLSTTNPYGTTKWMIEMMLRDICVSNPLWSIAILRYFNPIGAHESGLIGENPNGIPNNLMPYLVKVSTGEFKELKIFGNDYPTVDGTGVRDYIHVVDLAKGHLKAILYLFNHSSIETFNLGTGQGCSVLELVKIFEQVNHVSIPYSIEKRRLGDIASCYADVSKAKELLGWSSTKSIQDMCKDAYRYVMNQKKK